MINPNEILIRVAAVSLLTFALAAVNKGQGIDSSPPALTGQTIAASNSQRATETNAANYASFAAAVDALTGTGGTLTVSSPLSVTAGKSIPANVNVILQGAGLLTIAAGQSVTFQSAVMSDGRQHFAGPGRVVLRTQQTVDPKWWGAQDDYSAGNTDSTAAVQAALTALNGAGGGTLDVRARYGYVLAGSLNMDGFQNVNIKGEGNHSLGVKPNLIFTGAPANLITLRSGHGLNFDGFKILYTNAAFTGDVLHSGWQLEETGIGANSDPGYNRFNNLVLAGTFTARHANAGISLAHTIDTTIEKNIFYHMTYGISSGSSTVAVIKVSENIFKVLSNYPIYLAPGAEAWDISNNNFEDGFNPATSDGWGGPTRAIKGMGSNWAIHVENNWLGDGNDGTPGNDPMMAFTGCYGLTIINNRFANYGRTGQWGIALENATAVTITGNRFEGLNGITSTAATGYVYGANMLGNDFEGIQAYNVSGMIGPNLMGNFVGGGFVTNKLATTIISGSAGTDPIGSGTSDITFGRVYSGVSTGIGSGIRTTSSVGAHPDGSLVIQPRTDIGADIVLYNAYAGEALTLGANAVFGLHALPARTNTIDLGSSSLKWRSGYLGTGLSIAGGPALTTTNQTGTGSLVLATAPNLTTPTIGGGTALRQLLAATARLDFTALAANSCEEFAVRVTGAADGDVVSLGIPNALASADAKTTFFGFISAADTVKVRRCNLAPARTVDPATADVRVQVTKF